MNWGQSDGWPSVGPPLPRAALAHEEAPAIGYPLPRAATLLIRTTPPPQGPACALGAEGSPLSQPVCYYKQLEESSKHSPRSPQSPRGRMGLPRALNLASGYCRGYIPPLASLDWDNGFPPSSRTGLHPTLPALTTDPLLTYVSTGSGLGVLREEGVRGEAESWHCWRQTQHIHFFPRPKLCVFPCHLPAPTWVAWSSQNLLLVAARTAGSCAEEGASVEMSFPVSKHHV